MRASILIMSLFFKRPIIPSKNAANEIIEAKQNLRGVLNDLSQTIARMQIYKATSTNFNSDKFDQATSAIHQALQILNQSFPEPASVPMLNTPKPS